MYVARVWSSHEKMGGGILVSERIVQCFVEGQIISEAEWKPFRWDPCSVGGISIVRRFHQLTSMSNECLKRACEPGSRSGRQVG